MAMLMLWMCQLFRIHFQQASRWQTFLGTLLVQSFNRIVWVVAFRDWLVASQAQLWLNSLSHQQQHRACKGFPCKPVRHNRLIPNSPTAAIHVEQRSWLRFHVPETRTDNKDSVVDILNVVAVLDVEHSCLQNFSQSQCVSADFNCDGVVNQTDVAIVLHQENECIWPFKSQVR